MTSQLVAMLAAAGLVTAGVASTAETRSAASLPLPVMAGAASGGQCTVNVIRTGEAGSANIYRQQLENGACVCNIVTGPEANNGNAENAVRQLQSSRTCPDAPAAGANAAAQGANAGGVSGTVLGVLVGTVGAAGLVIAVTNNPVTPG
ncbi:MAG: hypothetical protein ACKOPQ_11770 [Novosphingobium sp.]